MAPVGLVIVPAVPQKGGEKDRGIAPCAGPRFRAGLLYEADRLTRKRLGWRMHVLRPPLAGSRTIVDRKSDMNDTT